MTNARMLHESSVTAGDKARAVEDGEHGRQLNLVVTVMQPCDDCAHQKTADNARVERGDAEDRALARRKIRGIDNASRRKERAHHGIHAHVAQNATKRRGSLLGLGKAIGEANREDNRDVVHNDAGSGLENRKKIAKPGAASQGTAAVRVGLVKALPKP